MSRSWTDLKPSHVSGLYSPLLTDTRQYQLLLTISCTKLYAVHSTTGTNYRAETDCRRTAAMEKQIPCFYAPDFFWWLLRHGSDKSVLENSLSLIPYAISKCLNASAIFLIRFSDIV